MNMLGRYNSKKWSNGGVIAASLYSVLPIVLFIFGWTKITYAILAVGIVCLIAAKLVNEFNVEGELFTSNISYAFIATIIICIWVYLSGIGGYGYQNKDFWARNPIYHDLIKCRWPVVYDLSAQSEFVKSITGTGKVAFSYYYTWWLVPAALSKILGGNVIVSGIILYLWAVLGLLILLAQINRIIGRTSYLSLLVLIFFSGMDCIPYLVFHGKMPFTEHIEWWDGIFQYSSNTTQLFWVFNQSIPVWILVCLFLQLQNEKYKAAIASLIFAYSPWAIFGIIPYVMFSIFSKKVPLKEWINPLNIGVPLLMLLVYGSFYAAGNGGNGGYGLIFWQYRTELLVVVIQYVMFVIIEFLLLFTVMGKRACKYEYYWVTLLVLLLYPLFYIRDENFVMRSSIPALFILMIYVLKYLIEERKDLNYLLLVLILVIGAVTPTTEITRSIVYGRHIEDSVHSFGRIETEDSDIIEKISNQFFTYDMDSKFFYKYVGKR